MRGTYCTLCGYAYDEDENPKEHECEDEADDEEGDKVSVSTSTATASSVPSHGAAGAQSRGWRVSCRRRTVVVNRYDDTVTVSGYDPERRPTPHPSSDDRDNKP